MPRLTSTIMTGKELAAALQVSEYTVARLRRENLIRCYRIRTMVRYEYEEVLDDLRRGNAEHGLRKIRAAQKSGGPRRRSDTLGPHRQPIVLVPRDEADYLINRRDDDDEHDRLRP